MSTPATGDTQVTIKVNQNGRMCRFKLPLRDMNASTLEDKLRASLHIDPSTNCVFERYSDSASAFVTLDRANISVYKQLYRAAKAKQRLKIKVTTSVNDESLLEPEPQKTTPKCEEPKSKDEDAQPSTQVPKPVTVEDEPETPVATRSEMTEISKTEPTPPAKPLVTNCVFPPSQEPAKPTSMTTGLYQPENSFNEFARMTALRPKPFDILGNPLNTHSQPEKAPTPPARPPKEMLAQEDIVNRVIPSQAPAPAIDRPTFAVCCNKCDATIPEAHYHCQTCDDGDFDLCQKCVDAGETCRGDDHWLIKRFVRGGQIIKSHTERISPKPKSKPESKTEVPVNKRPEPAKTQGAISPAPTAPRLCPSKPLRTLCEGCGRPSSFCFCHTRPPSYSRAVPIMQESRRSGAIRTCNCCVQEFPEKQFVHCTSCDDFDLCKGCFIKDSHGHHPGHGFEPAVEGDVVAPVVNVRLAPGRNQYHNAICDGCDKSISGVRHKCLDCPDWDYCSECVVNADFVHANHRFVPIFDGVKANPNRTDHVGICCDGPLCNSSRGLRYITGTRYKCAVCHDTDFCGNCEASPSNTHNKTHPLIKFKTPVRHVTVTTTGDKRDGAALSTMGDRLRNSTSSRATSTTTAAANNSSTAIQTLLDVSPALQAPAANPETEMPPAEPKDKEVAAPGPAPVAIPKLEDLEAVYVRDLVTDGTSMPPGTVFNQTWILKNAGKTAWPAGCSVKFVGGDYMGHIDPSHPASVLDLVSANESTVCYQPLEPGKEFAFNVLLRTPHREGKTISYWRLSTPDGHRFGHRLWCDVNVSATKVKTESLVEVKQEPEEEHTPKVEKEASPSESQMIFPKLEKESPVASIHEKVKPEPVEVKQPEPEETDDLDELAEVDEWDDDESFNTDEEYDLLDASDEEYSEANGKAAKK
ncbi:hypothetical protein MKZ38_003014 [Zalerion maritima]|uniref:ZZ-type domain-containing protein n=1 Tax=Zalerion maritima TaxID=339359 RepID=A0AAD5WQV5_9PEZI|nr:hypothetical protein MKZ38_003014 [Zalerion maritima]